MGDPLNIEIISRLERLEARMRAVESQPVPEPVAMVPFSPSGSSEVEIQVREQARELENLRSRLAVTEDKIAQTLASEQERDQESERQLVSGSGLPARFEEELDNKIEVRVEDMRAEIETDLAKLNRRTISTIERGVDERIGARVLPIEKAVRVQAKAIDDLRERFNLLENHLQRLVSTVERLVERPAPPATVIPVPPEQPAFRTYLDHAVKNDPIPSPPDVDPLFRPRIIKEDENRSQPGPRRPLSPLT